MAIIQFSNGQSIEFSGTPTQADVEEVATHLGIHSPKPTVAPQQMTGSAGQALIPGSSVWSNIKALPGQLADLGRKVIPGADAISSELGKTGQNIGLLAQGKNPNIPVDIPKLGGGILQAEATVAGLGAGGGVGSTVMKRVGTAALKYGAVGALDRAGNALEHNATPGDVLKSAGAGAALGAAGGAIGQGISEGVGAIKSATAKGISATGKDASEIGHIQESIAPKLTAKEQKLALAEGRIIPGQDPTLFRGGTADQVLPSKETADAAIVIKDNIPGASKMKPAILHGELDVKTGEMAKALRPVMDATPIQQQTIETITNDWEATKANQLADPYMPTGANVEKLQKHFEDNFLKTSKAENFGDLWDTRIKYDNSIPLNVKSATINSPENLQAQRSIWLQNRHVLNKAINNAANGLGDVSSLTFKEMNAMYNAKRAIESSVKVLKEGAPSRLVQWVKDNPVKATAIGVGVGGATGASGVVAKNVIGL